MDKPNSRLDRSLSVWLIVQSFIIIGAAIFAFLVVEVGSNVMFHTQMPVNLGYILGLILPMGAVLGALNYYLVKASYRYFSTLADAIETVADGDFHVMLDTKNAGPFTMVYENFNKMGAELQNVPMLRNDFINSYSHEFKTPIVSIKGFADLLLETDVTEDERSTYLKIISEEAGRLADLANSTILLSKLDAQQIITDKKTYALDEQLRKCAIMLSGAWEDKHISVRSNLGNVAYHGNEALMQHLWLNLLNNAVKFTPEGGEISIDLTEAENTVRVRIADTGIGMDQETAARIFDRYFQADGKESRQGLGLGLSIVRRIVELCGGEITVKSKDREGSEFLVILPNKK
ncbi:MAG: HAMP domain-containing sensor histidine kinase [Oscillospiraceae bacterium]